MPDICSELQSKRLFHDQFLTKVDKSSKADIVRASGAAGQLDMGLPSLTSLFQPTPQSRLFCFEFNPAFARELHQFRLWWKNFQAIQLSGLFSPVKMGQ